MPYPFTMKLICCFVTLATGEAIRFKNGQEKEFINAIKSLSAYAGYDCPELTFTGIENALNKSPRDRSSLYVFTDATAKDDSKEKLQIVNTQVDTLDVSVYFFTTGLCGKNSYKPFEDLAKQTFGQIFDLPKNGFDLARMKKISSSLLQGRTRDTGSACPINCGMKRRSINISDSFEHKLPFDDSMEKIIVLVTTEKKGNMIDLKDPLGIPVSTGKTPLPKGATFEVNHPTPGIWKLIVSSRAGKYSYLIKGSGETNVDFDFIFVILRKGRSPLPISHPLIGE